MINGDRTLFALDASYTDGGNVEFVSLPVRCFDDHVVADL